MDIREVKLSDIDMLVDNRLDFMCSIRNIVNKEEFTMNTRAYFKKHLESGSLISFIALDDEKIVASCILCIYETLPGFGCVNGRRGLLLNVYTLKNYRHQGLAYALLIKLIGEAKRLGVSKIQLDYTDDGYPLYKKLGFENLDREMVLKL